jgi:uncharacterized protein YaeQ
MALKATIYKAQVQLADMDRGIYTDLALTLARHPTETAERMVVRLLAYALHVPADDHEGTLEFTQGLFDADEPEIRQADLTGALVQWIDIGQPDERRMTRASHRATRATVWTYASSTTVWWAGVASSVARLPNLSVWQIPSAQAKAMAALEARTMQWQVSVQDGTVWLHPSGADSMEITPQRLK